MFDLTDRVALITGASGGIGASIARTLAGAGARCILSGTRVEALAALADEIGGSAAVLPADLGSAEASDSLAAAATGLHDRLDILVNNAGITRDTLALRMKPEDWDAVLQVNLRSVFLLSKAVLRPMMKARFGRIINITSVVGTTGNAGQANYAAAKAGVAAMSKSLAQEVAARGITVNCIAPGFIETPMTNALSDAQKAAIADTIPAGTLGQPADIAAGTLYLASQEARYITGQTLHINGGMAML